MERVTTPDEHPCSFCDFTLKCTYWCLSDAEKFNKCRAFYYFRLLQKRENEDDKK